MTSKALLKKVTTVACVTALLVTTFIPTAGAVDTDATKQVTEIETTTGTKSAESYSVLAKESTTQESATEESSKSYSKQDKSNVATAILGASLSPVKMAMGVDETYRLTPDFGKGYFYNWSSSDTSVVTVTPLGLVKARKTGKATITCTATNGQSAVCEITVSNAPETITLDKSYLVLGVGEKHDFSSYLNFGAGSYLRRYCSSNSIGLPTEASGGLTTAKAEGQYTIACFTYNGKLAKCTVVVKKAPTSLSLSSSSKQIAPGESCTLSPVFSSDSYSNQLSVSSSNTNVATVSLSSDNKLIVKATGTGSATIKAVTYNGKVATCKINVVKNEVNLSVTPTSTSILKGNHAYIKTSVTPSDTALTYSSSDTNVAKVSSNGIVTGVNGGTATITVTAGSTKKTCKINVSSQASDTYMPYSEYTLNNGKTLYLKSMGSSFSSSDTSVATVNANGFVTAKKQGVAIITANYGGSKRTCAITVIGSSPVRFSYSSPNSASKNEKVALVAITDKYRTSVKFDIKIGNTTKTVTATSKTLDSSGERYIWKGYYTFSSAGEYPVTAYSMYQNNGKYSTCSAGKSTVFVTDVSSSTTVSYSKRRPSDNILALNADYEGFLSCVTDDPLVYDTPTVGYGYVVQNGDEFYNNMSKEEAFAFMVSTMNDSYYSSAVNKFMSDNKLKFNQQQFDALVMLIYNLGSGVLYDYCVNDILTDCWHNGERNMNYVDKDALQEELIQWHHAGGCIWGLLYRRIDELEVFCYGDYTRDGSYNKYGMTYRWNCY